MSLSPSRQIDMVKQVLGIRGVGEGQRNCFTSTLPRASLEVDSLTPDSSIYFVPLVSESESTPQTVILFRTLQVMGISTSISIHIQLKSTQKVMKTSFPKEILWKKLL